MTDAVVKQRGRPKKYSGTRPQWKVRLREELGADVVEKARTLGLSLSEEIERRVERFGEYERAFGEARKIIDDAQKAAESGVEGYLRTSGYTPIRLDQGVVWAEPGMKNDLGRLSKSVDAAAIVRDMEPAIIKALADALRRATGGSEDQ